MKWYFALSESTTKDARYLDLLRVAVVSAIETTDLRPTMLWDGGSCELTRSLQALGVTIVPCVSRFADLIRNRWTDDAFSRIALGAYMRLEIPSLETEDDFVLYTDCDVVFKRNPRLGSFRPALMSLAPEFDFGNYTDINSGVILMNVAALRQEQAEFDRFVRTHFAQLKYDQSAIRWYYKNRFDFLPPTLNWKPYWGFAESVEILHLHLKPYHIRHFAENRRDADFDHLRPLYERNPAHCRHVAGAWYVLAEQARARILPDRPTSWPIVFDGAKYLQLYPDVAAAGADPFKHYVAFGMREGRAHPALETCG